MDFWPLRTSYDVTHGLDFIMYCKITVRLTCLFFKYTTNYFKKKVWKETFETYWHQVKGTRPRVSVDMYLDITIFVLLEI